MDQQPLPFGFRSADFFICQVNNVIETHCKTVKNTFTALVFVRNNRFTESRIKCLPYKVYLEHVLKPKEYQHRTQFISFIEKRLHSFGEEIIFSNEAHFKLIYVLVISRYFFKKRLTL